jgi:PAS domain S-box-containing protein
LTEHFGPDRTDGMGEIAAAAEGVLMVENAPLALAVVHPSGRLAMANRAFRALVEYEESELVGRGVWELVDETGFGPRWDEVLAGEVIPEHHARLRRRDGSSVAVRAAGMVVRDGVGAPRLVICRAEAI